MTEPPNDPRHWAEQVCQKAGKSVKIETLVGRADEEYRHHFEAEIVVPRFLRMEALLTLFRPQCADVATYLDGGEEVTQRYLDCYDCQIALGCRAWRWARHVFLPAHPEWQFPELDELRVEVEKTRAPQMVLF